MGYGGIRTQSAYAGTQQQQQQTGPGQSHFTRSPYATYSNFAPPPRRNPNPTPNPAKPRPQPQYAHGTGPSPGAARATNFARPPRPAAQGGFANTKDDSERDARERANAWERMRASNAAAGNQPWSDNEFHRGRAAQDTANAHPSKPGFGRSNTTKTPRKGGFNPSAPGAGDWEPQAPNYSSYRPVPPIPTASKPQPPPVPPRSPQPPPPPRTNADTANMFRAANGEEDVPFTEGARIRTPYTSHSGERTYFSNNESIRRSASVREGAQGSGTSTPNRPSPRGTNTRHRSHSPSGRTTTSADTTFSPQASARKTSGQQQRRKPVIVDYESSEESSAAESSPSSDTSTKPMFGGPADPDLGNRSKAKPGSFWKRSDSPLKDQVPGSQTAPDTPLDGQSKAQMYDNFSYSFLPGLDQNRASSAQQEKRTPTRSTSDFNNDPWKEGFWKGGLTNKSSFWSVPSSVTPKAIPPKTPASQPKQKPLRKVQGFDDIFSPFSGSSYQMPPPASGKAQPTVYFSSSLFSSQFEHIANISPSSRFDVPKGYDTEPPNGFKSASTDNISTTFNQSEWEGRFKGSKDFMPRPTPTRKGSKTSALRRTPGRTSGAHPLGSQNNPIDITSPAGIKIPPPPPMPPATNRTSTFKVPNPPPPPPGPVKFSSEEWAKTLKNQTFFLPTERPTSPSKANSSSTRRPKVVRGRKPSRVATNAPAPPSVAISDASDEDSEAQPAKTKGSAHPKVEEPEAMDIDSEIPGAFGATSPDSTKGPRLVNIPPARPEWRDGHTKSTTAVPTAAGGRVPSGTIPTAVPNAAIPPPPPMPPPPPKTTMKKPKVKKNSINLDDLKNVTPLGPTGSEGLQGFSDLTGTLPFESQPSAHPIRTFEPRDLELPAPPKAPTAPPTGIRMTETQWKSYVGAMSFYMGKWYGFNDLCLKHFGARHHASEIFGTGIPSTAATKALEAIGEGSAEEGLLSYVKGVEEDVRVRKHWDVASEKHRVAVEEFVKVKERVKVVGLAQA
jgi:hypothetical protein